MSYCRWSSDGYKCDVYVYEHVHGGWTTHVAGRKKIGLDTLPPDPMTLIEKMGSHEWQQAYDTWHEAYDKLDWKDHTAPFAGDTFSDDSPGECAKRLIELRGLGYHIPQYAIDALLEEQTTLSNGELP